MLEKYESYVFRPTIAELEGVVRDLEELVGEPAYIEEDDDERLTYNEQNREVICLLRSVRIVSSLNAFFYLLKAGFIQEMGMIVRAVYEFLEDIGFLLYNYQERSLTDDQTRFVQEFFEDEAAQRLVALEDYRPLGAIPRRKVRAAIADFLVPKNPHDTKKVFDLINDAFSGYVHGRFRNTMELYNSVDGFCLNGVPRRIREWYKQFNIVLHHSLCVFGVMCAQLGFHERSAKLLQIRNALESTVGMKFDVSAEDSLRKLKRRKRDKKYEGLET